MSEALEHRLIAHVSKLATIDSFWVSSADRKMWVAEVWESGVRHATAIADTEHDAKVECVLQCIEKRTTL